MGEEHSPLYQDRATGHIYADAREMVTDYLERFARDVGSNQDEPMPVPVLDERGYAVVAHGEATIGINVLESHGILMLLSRIMTVPQRDEVTFCRKLLELNYLATSDAAFAIDKESNSVYLRAMRQLSGLHYEEFSDILETVASVADEWKGKLLGMFEEL